MLSATWLFAAGLASASTLVQQTWLPGSRIPQFEAQLPVFGPAGSIPRVNALQHPSLKVTMKEINQQVMPASTGIGPTRVWAYEISDSVTGMVVGTAHWPAVTVEATRTIPTTVTYENQLPSFGSTIKIGAVSTTALLQGLISVDKTIHWADPLNSPNMNPCMDNPLGAIDCSNPFTSSVPAVPHLHGGEVPSAFDGGPEAWFAPNGKKGPSYSSYTPTTAGKAVYVYPNLQEPGTLWFHDHALGATRTNVYSGLAAFYFLRDSSKEPVNLPTGKYEIELAIQDRQFDTNGQLFFPDGSGGCGSGLPTDPCLNGPPPNPDMHPFWNPEFVGDVVVVNGAPWPKFNVEAKRYRFRLLDGSNARMYNLKFGDVSIGQPTPPVYAIAADDNYLNTPARVQSVFIAPGERADVIVDFTGLAGKTVTVTNDAPVPYPDGLVPGSAGQEKMGQIMRFNVVAPVGGDTSCNPATGGCRRPTPAVALTDGRGHLASGVKIDKVRQLVLKENEGAGGPLEVFVNNTSWDGRNSAGIKAIFPGDGVSELPRIGSTELWEIINLTSDAHPIHTHLTQFQILNREGYDTNLYPPIWEGAFGTGPVPLPSDCVAGTFCPGYGPPRAYNVPNADGALGGNPAISPYLLHNATAPAPEEAGWKDTAKVQPGQVLRMVIRWAPTSTASSAAGQNYYSFDPTQGPGYVWHCHIIDHEDNEMMRPYKVAK